MMSELILAAWPWRAENCDQNCLHMTYYPDQSPCDYFGPEEAERLLAIGWLDSPSPFNKGSVDPRFLKKLAELLVAPWQPAVTMGKHDCTFCRFTGGPAAFSFGGLDVPLGVSNVFIPADGFLFVAPSLILHYIDSHRYSPPSEFQQAVLVCPPMRSMEYLRAIVENGPKGF
jgi:hypothetical protein